LPRLFGLVRMIYRSLRHLLYMPSRGPVAHFTINARLKERGVLR
jgi:hypothetical protein